MNKKRKEVCSKIIQECTMIGGFAIELRASNFLEDNFNALIENIEKFRELNYGEEKIELEIAYCLHVLVHSIRGAIHYSNGDDRRKLQDALVTISDLVTEILWPDYLQDPQKIQEKWGLNL